MLAQLLAGAVAENGVNTDRNLLFGVLALQADLISQEQFVEACTLWATQKQTPLAELLGQRGWLSTEDRSDVEKLLQRTLDKHVGDAKMALTDVTTDIVRQTLAEIDDVEVQQSIAPRDGNSPQFSTAAYDPESRERYKLNRLHATGGIGQVWLAHDDSLGRDVALKELRPERLRSQAAWSRFLREAQITGQLEHPGIVPVYELSQRRDEQQYPFYTMRFIRGRTLHEAAEAYHQARQRGEATTAMLRELLTAFIGVCNTVAYAHSRGVIHRDLKPRNIAMGDFGEVIVLDWGLAKVVGEADADVLLAGQAAVELSGEGSQDHTLAGQVLGTPSYMSPEQAEGRLDLIDERTDVYGLGAILYQILTGGPPFGNDETPTVLRRVIHDSIEPPSAVVRNTPPALEAICLKALAKRLPERYQSAKELAAEVERWLGDDPVTAYGEPFLRRAGRWVRRHRLLVTSAGLLLAATSIALAVIAILVEQARRQSVAEQAQTELQRQRAEGNLDKAMLAVDRMLSRVGEQQLAHIPQFDEERRKILEDALELYQTLLDKNSADPDVRLETGRAFRRMGDIGRALGRTADAEQAYVEAMNLLQNLVAEYPQNVEFQHALARTHHNLGLLLQDLGRLSEAETTQKKALAIERQLVAARPSDHEFQLSLATTAMLLGALYQESGRLEPAEIAYDESKSLWEQLVVHEPDEIEHRRGLGTAHQHLAWLYETTGRITNAEESYQKALSVREAIWKQRQEVPSYQYDLAWTQNSLGWLYKSLGRNDEAERLYEQAIELREQLARNHPQITSYQSNLGQSLYTLAWLYQNTGRTPQAESTHQRALGIWQQLVGDNPEVPEHRKMLAWSYNDLALLYQGIGQREKAVESHQLALDLRQALVDEHPGLPEYQEALAASYNNLGTVYITDQKQPESAAAYRKALEIRQAIADAHPDVPRYQATLSGSHYNLGYCLHSADPDQAEAAYQKAFEIATELAEAHPSLPDYQSRCAQIQNMLGSLYQSAEKPERAQAAFQQAVEIQDRLAGDHPTLTEYSVDLAGTCCNLGHLTRDYLSVADSLQWYQRSVETLQDLLQNQPSHAVAKRYLSNAYLGRAEALNRLEQYADAVRDLDEALELTTSSNRPWIFAFRANLFSRMGEHDRAVADAQTADAPAGDNHDPVKLDAKTLFRLACVFGRAGSSGTAEADRYPDRALALLRQAVEEGYRDADAIRAESAFDALRQRDEFQGLLLELEAKGDMDQCP